MNKFLTAILTLAALSIAIPAGLAQHCSRTTTSDAFERDGHYVVLDDCLSARCLPSVWVYEETNGIKGLQRGDFMKDDTCHGRIKADTVVI